VPERQQPEIAVTGPARQPRGQQALPGAELRQARDSSHRESAVQPQSRTHGNATAPDLAAPWTAQKPEHASGRVTILRPGGP
jgi:hypothetical protein